VPREGRQKSARVALGVFVSHGLVGSQHVGNAVVLFADGETPLRQALRSSRTRASLLAVKLDGNRSVRYTGGYARFFLAIRPVSLSGSHWS